MSTAMQAPTRDEGGETADVGTFADRLNRLFSTVHPPCRGPYTSQEMVGALKLRGLSLSAPYLSQLRNGERTQPSPQTIGMIAGFFGVRTEYFTEPDSGYARHVDDELRWLELTHNPSVRRLTTSLLDLDSDTRDRLLADAGI